jgi:hypothetical protein
MYAEQWILSGSQIGANVYITVSGRTRSIDVRGRSLFHWLMSLMRRHYPTAAADVVPCATIQ